MKVSRGGKLEVYVPRQSEMRKESRGCLQTEENSSN